jgi:N-acetylmuramoyl-L-alanine amidase
MAVKDKYSIERKYVTNSKARSKAKLNGGKPGFFVAHETANNSADADAHYRYFQGITISASAHTFIDDGKILEIIPLDEKAWHVQYQQDKKTLGLGAANDNAIGTELCRTGNFSKAYDRFVWYHAYLCKKYGKQPKKHITAHKFEDPARRSDPQSWLEPNGVSWSKFLSDVQNYFDNWGGDATVKVETKATTTKTAPSTSDDILEKGDKGAAVTELQKDIIAKGFSLPKYGADGDFGDETVAAVKALQKAAGIAVDGIVGPNTRKALAEYKKPAAKVASTAKTSGSAVVPYPGKLIKRGSKGKDVGRIQRAVGVTADEDFGPATEAAVKAYQKRKGLSADGIVGPATWNVMF